MRYPAIPATYSRTDARKLTKCDLIRHFQDTIQDSEIVGGDRLQITPSPARLRVLRLQRGDVLVTVTVTVTLSAMNRK